MKKWIWWVMIGAGVLGLATFAVNTLQLGDPPQNETYTQDWALPAGTMKQLKIQSDYEIVVQFTPSPDGKDHVALKGAIQSGIRQQLEQTALQDDTLQLPLHTQRRSWQIVQPGVRPHVQYITVQLANPNSLKLADFHLVSAQTNLNHIQAEQIHVESSSGRIKAKQLEGDVKLTTSQGNIIVNAWKGHNLDVKTGSGQLQIDKATGHVHSFTGSGPLQISQLGGDADIVSHSGDVELTLQGSHNLKVTTRSANIRVATTSTFAGNYDARSQSGKVQVPERENIGSHTIHAYSETGEIQIEQD